MTFFNSKNYLTRNKVMLEYLYVNILKAMMVQQGLICSYRDERSLAESLS